MDQRRLTDPSAVFGASVTPGRERTVVAVSGELDIRTVDALRQSLFGALEAGGGARLVVDVAGVEFISSRGLATLLEVREHAAALGVTLALSRPGRHFERVLEMGGLAAVFAVEPG